MVNVCKHCMKQYIGSRESFCCKDCRDIDNMRYEQIRAYLKVYPNSNAIQIADAIGVKPYVVLKYVDEGRLLIGKGEFEQL